MIDLYEKGIKKYDWWPDWRGECVAIIGAGPSAKTAGVEKLKNRMHCIAINESYQICPWAEILYSCDAAWWQLRQVPINGFAGLKIAFECPREFAKTKNMKQITVRLDGNRVYCNEFLFDEPGTVGAGGHSGFQAMNMAAQFGATGIALIGFDMDATKGVHWHGFHPVPLRNPDHARFMKWREILDSKADQLKVKGIDVVNCSPISSLTKFPKLTIEQTLERWGL